VTASTKLASLFVASIDVTGRDLTPFRTFAREHGRVIERNELALFATGTAAQIDLPHGLRDPAGVAAVTAALASAEGGTPIALGALPFDPAAPAHLVVPSTVLVERPGSAHTLLAGRSRDEVMRAAERWASAAETEQVEARWSPPDSFSLRSAHPHDDFRALVASTVAAIRSGQLEKAVLVREVVIEANRDLHLASLQRALRRLYPSCAVFSVEGFVGASPELLLARTGGSISSHPLAGTIGRSGDEATDAALEDSLLHSAKDRSEHRVVVDAIAASLRPWCSQLDVPGTPSIVRLRNVSHLGTEVQGRLEAGAAGPSALELVACLHPTPAVAGTPTDAALAWIAAHEKVQRGPYTGVVGWVDAAGDGEWYVGIRAALVAGKTARLFAGAGIVADSDPDEELTETQLKLQALLAAAVRP
jgi:menaquinone-specific isochorismate synthase